MNYSTLELVSVHDEILSGRKLDDFEHKTSKHIFLLCLAQECLL